MLNDHVTYVTLKRIFVKDCKFAQLFISGMLAVLPALSSAHKITFADTFVCIGHMTCSLLNPVSPPPPLPPPPHFCLDDCCLAVK